MFLKGKAAEMFYNDAMNKVAKRLEKLYWDGGLEANMLPTCQTIRIMQGILGVQWYSVAFTKLLEQMAAKQPSRVVM